MKVPGLVHSMRINSVFSAASGMAAVVLAMFEGRPLGLNRWLLAAVGAGLIVYGAQLALWSRRPSMLAPGARLATVADTAWVIGAVIILVGFPAVLDVTGRVVLGVLSLVVAELAVLQFIGLRREASVVGAGTR